MCTSCTCWLCTALAQPKSHMLRASPRLHEKACHCAASAKLASSIYACMWLLLVQQCHLSQCCFECIQPLQAIVAAPLTCYQQSALKTALAAARSPQPWQYKCLFCWKGLRHLRPQARGVKGLIVASSLNRRSSQQADWDPTLRGVPAASPSQPRAGCRPGLRRERPRQRCQETGGHLLGSRVSACFAACYDRTP